MVDDIRIRVFQNCCGVQEIGNFYRMFKNGRYETYENLAKRISRAIEKLNPGLYSNTAMAVATLNDGQKPDIGPILKKFGFNLVAASKRPNGGNILYLYVKTFNPVAITSKKKSIPVRRGPRNRTRRVR